MKTIKTILVVAVAIAIASIAIRVTVLKRPAAQEVARESAERKADLERARNHSKPLTAPAVASTASEPLPFEEITKSETTNSRESNAAAALLKTVDQTRAIPQKVSPQAQQVPQSKDGIQDPLARVALSFVGDDPEAEQYWLEAINNPSLSAHERKDLIEDLNEDGLSDPRNPALEDLPLIVNRILLVEDIAPQAMDQVNADAFQEAYKDLVNMYVRLTRP